MRILLLLTSFLFVFAYTVGGQVAPKRLVAESYYTRNSLSDPILLTDSARYFYYDSLRGSRFDYNNLRYADLSLIGSAPVADFLNIEMPTNNIDSSDYLLVGFDTANYYSSRGIPLHGEGRNYLSNGTIPQVNNTTYSAPGVIDGRDRFVNVYSGGLLSKVYVTYFNAGVYDTSFVRFFYYDGSGRMVLDSLSSKTFGPRLRKTFTYYATGAGYKTRTIEQYKTSTSSFTILGRTTRTYDAAGRVVTSFGEGYSSGFYPSGIDSFGYTAGVPGYTFRSEKTLSGTPTYNFETVTNRINAFGKKDSVTFSSYSMGNFDGGSTTRVNYDSDGDPLSVYIYRLESDYKSTLFAVSNYYYNRQATVSAGTVKGLMTDISIAPNPTSGKLWLRYLQPAGATPVTVAITNMAGQLVHSEHFTPQGRESMITLGDEVPMGAYCLTITAGNGARIYSSVFVKR